MYRYLEQLQGSKLDGALEAERQRLFNHIKKLLNIESPQTTLDEYLPMNGSSQEINDTDRMYIFQNHYVSFSNTIMIKELFVHYNFIILQLLKNPSMRLPKDHQMTIVTKQMILKLPLLSP